MPLPSASRANPLLDDERYQGTYRKLLKVAKQGETAMPFITLVPPVCFATKTLTDTPRIIWYGAATNGWEKPWPEKPYNIARAHAEGLQWLQTEFRDRKMTSRFWRVQAKCLPMLGLSSPEVAWGNVWRVGGLEGDDNGKPSAYKKDEQTDLCVEAFHMEMAALEPDLVVLHVGEIANQILHNIAGLWAGWNVRQHDGSDIAAYRVNDGLPMIWLSRRSATDAAYMDAFAWCLEGLGIERRDA